MLLGDFTVALESHTAMETTPVGPAEVDLMQFKVFVQGEGIKLTNHRLRNDAGKIHVGYIGKQAQANFMPIGEFYEFTPAQQTHIVVEAKKLHGSATEKPHVDLPPEIPAEQSDGFEDGQEVE